MKIKKILSGILALAMLGSMGISASAMTEDELLEDMEEIYEEELVDSGVPEDYYFVEPDYIPEFESVEELREYFDSIGFTSELGSNYLTSDDFIESHFTRYEVMRERYDVANTIVADDGTVIVTSLDIGIQGVPLVLGEKYDDYMHYIIYNGEAYITGSTEFDANLTEYTIPDEIDGCPVVAIGESIFRHFPNLETVTIPNTVRSIGAGTFRINAFNGLKNLKNVKLSNPDQPSELQTIGAGAFSNCYNLESFDGFESSNLSYIGQAAFSDCENLSVASLPSSLTEIGEYAFDGANIFVETINETGKCVIPSEPFKKVLYDDSVEESVNSYLTENPDATEAEIAEFRYETAFNRYCYNRLGIYSTSAGIKVSSKLDEDGNIVYRLMERDFNIEEDVLFSDGDIFEVDGDVNFDGKVGAVDISLVKKYVLNGNKTDSNSAEETEILSTMQKYAASVDNSTNVDVKSLIKVKRAALQ